MSSPTITGDAAATTKELMQSLIDQGWAPEAAAGVAGNLLHESDQFRADTEYGQAPGKGGRGWAQWTGPRRRAFEAWAESEGLDPTSKEANMGFLLREMEGKHGNHWTGGYSLDQLKQMNDPAAASDYFMKGYERPGVPHADKRAGLASEALNLYTGGGPPAAAPSFQDAPKMANLGPFQLPMMPSEAAGMGAPMATPGIAGPVDTRGISFGGAVPPPPSFMMPQFPGMPMPGGQGGPLPQTVPGAPPGINMLGSLPGGVSGAGQALPEQGGQMTANYETNDAAYIPPPPPGGGLGGQSTEADPEKERFLQQLGRRLGNTLLPGQPFNANGQAMSEGLANTFTAGERGDGQVARTQKRIDKALAKSERLRERGKTKRADRKQLKADRLASGDRVGAMRWLFGPRG